MRSGICAALAAISVLFVTDPAYAQPECVTGFDPPVVTMPSGGLSAPVTIFRILTSSPTCEWKLDGVPLPSGGAGFLLPPWMGYPTPRSGTGPATISLDFLMPNRSSAPLEVTLIYSGKPIVLTNPPDPCPFTVSAATPASLPANGGSGSFTVTTSGQGCTYYARPGEGVAITSGASGSVFPAIVSFSLGPNTTSSPAQRSVSVGSSPGSAFVSGVTIQQSGPPVATDLPTWRDLSFAVHRASGGPPYVSSAEPLRITNTEDPSAAWTATTTVPWLDVSPASGSGPGATVLSINPAAAAQLGLDQHLGEVRIVSTVAPNTPLVVRVWLRVTSHASQTGRPFGYLEIPRNGATGLSGAVPFGGWAVDDVGITRVQVYRNAVAGEPAGPIYLADATRVRGARPDVLQSMFWGHNPGARSAGWGLMVLSNTLPNNGNGTYTFSAFADDAEGNRTRLGDTTVTFDNTNSVFPFGTIDVPGQGATVSGTLNNQGWILAQPGRSIPGDGSTIRLFVDGAEQPNVAAYGFARPDVAALFPAPTYSNSAGPAVLFTVDTTAFADGMHSIVWHVHDNLGTLEGIGSRFFHIQNGGASQVVESAAVAARSAVHLQSLPQASGTVLWERRGFSDGPWSLRFAGRTIPEISARRGERIEVALDTWWAAKPCGRESAYLKNGDVAGPLPPGATFDASRSRFSWQPPIEFAGGHEFVFVRTSCSGGEERIPLRVTLGPQ